LREPCKRKKQNVTPENRKKVQPILQSKINDTFITVMTPVIMTSMLNHIKSSAFKRQLSYHISMNKSAKIEWITELSESKLNNTTLFS